jgi:hypothetical protein
MNLLLSDFERQLTGPTGILQLMEDPSAALESSASGSIMMGGGNPARMPTVEAVWRRRLAEIQSSVRSCVATSTTAKPGSAIIGSCLAIRGGRLGVGWARGHDRGSDARTPSSLYSADPVPVSPPPDSGQL